MKVFYFYGLHTRRSDPQWFMWSVLLSAPVAAFRAWLGLAANDIVGVAVAAILGLLGGIATIWVWRRTVDVWPRLRVTATVGAWDSVFGVPWGQWVQVKTTDGLIYLGWPAYVGKRSDTDDPDIYLRQVQLVSTDSSTIDLGADGLLLSRSRIESIVVFPGNGQPRGASTWVEGLSDRWADWRSRLVDRFGNPPTESGQHR